MYFATTTATGGRRKTRPEKNTDDTFDNEIWVRFFGRAGLATPLLPLPDFTSLKFRPANTSFLKKI